jgi:uncharacterized protein
MFYAGLLVLGIMAGVFGGLFGIGGGTIVIPALVYLFGLTQHQAQGTSLAMMVPPVTFLAAWTYYRSGHVDLKLAVFVSLGFIIGGLLGATVVQPVNDPLLRKGFGIFLLLVGAKMLY